ncbi:MAG: ribonuclease III [Clostridiales bacterium]|nr:ribonuclease III [Clostridiales bacterium]
MNPTLPAPQGTAAVRLFETLPGTSLAYIGDAVIELLARERLLQDGITHTGKLSALARAYVTAKNQSQAIERLLPMLNEEETAYYKRGRNASGVSVPKSATAGEYRRATGMEALFGYLYLAGKQDRLRELFAAAFDQPEGSED